MLGNFCHQTEWRVGFDSPNVPYRTLPTRIDVYTRRNNSCRVSGTMNDEWYITQSWIRARFKHINWRSQSKPNGILLRVRATES